MAAIFISEPGSKYGPCKKPCQHKDCAASRAQADAVCPFCGEAIGYNNLFVEYSDALTVEYAEAKLWHRSCLETWVEQEREREAEREMRP